MVKGAPSLNQRGAPRKSRSLAEKIRQAVSDEELIAFAVNGMNSPDLNWRERLLLHAWLANRSHGVAPQTLDIQVGMTPSYQLPPHWRTLTSAEREAWLDDLSLSRLASGSGDVIDVLEDDGEADE